MAISFVGQAQAAATTVTTPTHAVGDLIIIFAYRNTTTAPSLPAGYTTINTASGNSNSYRVGYKIATATNDSSGTWTNAKVLQCVVYRGVGGISGIGNNSGATKAASTTANIPARTMQDASGGSWVVAFAGSRQTTSQGAPLAGATTQRGTSQAGTTSMAMVADTNGGVSSFSATTSANGSSVTSSGISIEILPPGATAAAALTDDFDDNSLDATKWESGTTGGSTFAETNQQIEEAPASLVAGAESYMPGLGFNAKYNLTGSAYYAQLKQTLTPDVNTYQWLHAMVDDLNEVYFQITGNPQQLEANKIIAGVDTNVASVTYNSTTHAWLRIRESGGTIFWDYSADGSSWTNLTSLANPFAITRTYPKLNAVADNVTTPGTTIWDNFNTTPTSNITATPGVATLTLATFAPTVSTSNNQLVTAGLKTLTLATFAPAANVGINVVAGLATLSLSSFVPTIINPQLVTVPLKTLALSAFAPQLQAVIRTPLSTLSLATFLPAVTATDYKTATPGVLAVVTTSFAPAVTATDYKTATPGLIALTLTGLAPVVTVPQNKVAVPDLATLLLVTFAPTATGNHFGPVTDPGTGSLTPQTPTAPGGWGTQGSSSGNWPISPAIPDNALTPQNPGGGSFTPQA